MGQSTEELNSDIEATRARMASDLDTLQDKVSPSAIVERRKQAARTRVSSMRDRVMGTADSVRNSASGAASGTAGSASDAASNAADAAQDRFAGNPLGAGILAFGAGLVLASLLPATRTEADAAHRVSELAKEQGQPLLDEVKQSGQQVAEHVKEQATDAVQQVKESAQDSAATVQEQGKSAADSVRGQAQGS